MNGRQSDSPTYLEAGTRVGKSACSEIIDRNQTKALYLCHPLPNLNVF